MFLKDKKGLYVNFANVKAIRICNADGYYSLMCFTKTNMITLCYETQEEFDEVMKEISRHMEEHIIHIRDYYIYAEIIDSIQICTDHNNICSGIEIATNLIHPVNHRQNISFYITDHDGIYKSQLEEDIDWHLINPEEKKKRKKDSI